MTCRHIAKSHMDYDLGLRRSGGRCTGERCRRRASSVWDWGPDGGLRAYCEVCRRSIVGPTADEKAAEAAEAAKRQGSLF